MSTNSLQLSAGNFGALFAHLISHRKLGALARQHRKSPAGAPAKIKVFGLVSGMVFHMLQVCGMLSTHVQQVSGKRLADSTLSERRQALGFDFFQALLDIVLGAIARVDTQPRAFYKGFLLTGIDGTSLSVSNTPPIKESAKKTRSRRSSSAFYRLSLAAIYELGTHNPLAARVGLQNESEMKLATALLPLLPKNSLLIGDRYYGVAKFVFLLLALQEKTHCLLRIRKNLKSKLLQQFRDGSCLVEIKDKTSGQRILLREINARVRRTSGHWTSVRLWTTLLDPTLYPAKELVELYGLRWEQECAYKELKIHLRRQPLLLSHTLITAAQEVACLVMAQAIVARLRFSVADAYTPVLQISFVRTLHLFRSLWSLAPVFDDLISDEDWPLFLRRIFALLTQQTSQPRRKRSCPRALRQPVSKWPRLLRNSYTTGPFQFKITRNQP